MAQWMGNQRDIRQTEPNLDFVRGWGKALLHAAELTEQKVDAWVKAQARIESKLGEHLGEMNLGTKIASRQRGGLTHARTLIMAGS